MMILVMLVIAFMWIVQVFFLEKNIVTSTTDEIQLRMEPVLTELEQESDSIDASLLVSLSRAVNGKMLVIDKDGTLLHLYSAGHQLGEESEASINSMLKYLEQSKEYLQLFDGKSYNKVLRYGSDPIALEIGIPITYAGKQASVIFYQTLDQLHTVLMINRNQLILLSIGLTLIAAAVAALLSLRFVKPIRILKNTVDSLAKGDFEATPGLHLHDELGQLSNSVEELSQALKRIDVLRKEVIANVSHELKSPLALISGYAEMVRDISWKENAKRQEDLTLIIKEAGRMSEMVDDILDYSQLQAGYIQLKKDWYTIEEIIDSEIEHCIPIASEFDISIVFNNGKDPVPVFVDAMKISQVIRNLLNNAVNHTADHETVIVTLKENIDRIRVSVKNPGNPIPKEDLDIIWEKYKRSQHLGRRNCGTGIGLSIVSTFLKAHEMPYGVSSTEELTEFWFEIPRQQGSVHDYEEDS